MTQPLALLLYEKLLPGTQLVNRLQDLGWRIHVIHDATALAQSAEEQKPVLVLVDLVSTKNKMTEAISGVRKNQSTAHIPIIAFSSDEALNQPAAAAGAHLVVGDAAILQHLNHFIDQALSDF